jgi:hypothetical protein
MLNIFKNFACKTSILDDFDFYENRQKVMQDRRGKPLTTLFDHPLVCSDELNSLNSYSLTTVLFVSICSLYLWTI